MKTKFSTSTHAFYLRSAQFYYFIPMEIIFIIVLIWLLFFFWRRGGGGWGFRVGMVSVYPFFFPRSIIGYCHFIYFSLLFCQFIMGSKLLMEEQSGVLFDSPLLQFFFCSNSRYSLYLYFDCKWILKFGFILWCGKWMPRKCQILQWGGKEKEKEKAREIEVWKNDFGVWVWVFRDINFVVLLLNDNAFGNYNIHKLVKNTLQNYKTLLQCIL